MVRTCLVSFAIALPLFALLIAGNSAGRGSAPALSPPTIVGAPKAVLTEELYDFGALDPHVTGFHEFLIRNEGNAPLRLVQGTTTCRCTRNEVLDHVVPPGGTGRVAVQWKTSDRSDRFRQAAYVQTNDPEHSTLKLRIEGEVIVRLKADPPELIAPCARAGQASAAQTIVYSQKYAAFQLGEPVSTLPGVTCRVTPADTADLARLDALAGYRLDVELPANLPEGEFSGSLHFPVAADGMDAAPPFEIAVHGKVPRRLAVYGEGVGADGTIHLGPVGAGQETTRRFMLKVRDDDTELRVRRITTRPAWLRATVKPMESAPADAAFYQLILTLSPDAPLGIYEGDTAGALEIEFDHPRIHALKMNVEAIVATPR